MGGSHRAPLPTPTPTPSRIITMKWGVLATGSIANDFSRAAKVAGAHLYAVASRRQASADAFKDRLGFDKAYGSYSELFSDTEVDVVYIATPHSDHYAYILQALDAGKHVVCEKPLCWSLTQAEAAVRKARACKLFLMEAMWTRFFPLTRRATEAVASGEIGEIVSITARSGFAAPNPPQRLTDKALAGGITLDVGSTRYPGW